MSPATSPASMFCSMRGVPNRAAILFDHGLVPLPPMVQASGQSIFPLAGDKVAGGSGQ